MDDALKTPCLAMDLLRSELRIAQEEASALQSAISASQAMLNLEELSSDKAATPPEAHAEEKASIKAKNFSPDAKPCGFKVQDKPKKQSIPSTPPLPKRTLETSAADALKIVERYAQFTGGLDTLIANVRSAVARVKKEGGDNCVDVLREAKGRLTATIKEGKILGINEGDLVQTVKWRRKVHNMIEDCKGSIRIFGRVRALTKKEKNCGESQVVQVVDGMSINVGNSQFTLDAAFSGGQEEVFDDCQDLVQSAFDGYHVGIIAYGQTGAGKTFTTFGTPKQPGLIPRMANEVFNIIGSDHGRIKYTITASMIELYRNDPVDLLVTVGGSRTNRIAAKPCFRLDQKGHVQFENVHEETCDTAEELLELIKNGSRRRQVAPTAMNQQSSRSHVIVIVRIISLNRETQETLRGKIVICDLAGSERLKRSLVTGDAQKDTIDINKSLSALGDVIQALTDGSTQIPYRNHRLTQVIQDSIGGTAKTLMFVACSPASADYDETLASLRWATRAKRIESHKRAHSVPALPRSRSRGSIGSVTHSAREHTSGPRRASSTCRSMSRGEDDALN
jgi:hypothetical protein